VSYFDAAYVAKFYLDEPESDAGGRAAALFARLPRSVFLRAADALHLTCAREHGLHEIYTNDRHMSVAARYFRLRVRSVPPR